MGIPFIDLAAQYQAYRDEIDRAVAQVLQSHVYINGPEVSQFEQELCNFTGCQAALGCSSGTDALLLALLALGVGPGDEVITPSFTFVATAEVVALLGAKVVFADVDYNTALVSAATVEPHLTPATRAIVPVSLFGQCAETGPLGELAAEAGVTLVEDAAQSFGARQVNRYSGAMTPLACTSFFPAKPLGCYGDGGAVLINDMAFLEPLRELRNHGQHGQYDYTRIGINGRLDAIQAAILRVKLRHFAVECETRQQVAERYDVGLCSQVRPLEILGSNYSVYAQYTLRCPKRDQLKHALAGQGIPSAVYYPRPLHLQTVYAGPSGQASLPTTERLAQEVLSLPMSPFLTLHHQQRVIDAVNAFYARG